MTYGLNFHKTFAPEKEALSQLVRLSSEEPGYLSKEEISQRTTIPTGESSGKVVPNIIYGEMMGLLQVEKVGGSYRLSLTPFGHSTYIEDPYFTEELTLLACHYNLTKVDSSAILWSYIFNKVIPQLGTSLTKDTLFATLNRQYGTDVNLTPFRSCYLNNRSLGALGFLRDEVGRYLFIKHKVDPSLKYLYAYQLTEAWEKVFSDRSELTINDIFGVLRFGSPYLWEEKDVLIVLELLQDERIVVLNRQLSPLTVIKQVSTIDLVNRLYSLLI